MAHYPGLGVLDKMEDPLSLLEVHQPSPERRLAVAVLGEVVEDLRRGPGASLGSQLLYRDTREYVRSDDTDWPFSFMSLCETLGLEPERTREGLLAIKPGAVGAAGLRASAIGTPQRIVAHRVPKGRRAAWWSGDRVPQRRGAAR